MSDSRYRVISALYSAGLACFVIGVAVASRRYTDDDKEPAYVPSRVE